MRTKKPFLFDEKIGAEKTISLGFPDGKIDYGTMYSVAKFYRQEFGYGEIRLERELIRFCQENDKTFNPIIEAAAIKKWVKVAMKYRLREIDEIKICSDEMSFLRSIQTPKDRKILFITLVVAKAIKQSNVRLKKKYAATPVGYFIRYSNFPDIIRLSKINNLTEVGLADIYHKYKEHFIFYSPEKELIRLNYASLYSEGWTILKNLEDINEEYVFLFGKNQALCRRCKTEFIKNAKNEVLCQNCKKELRKEIHKITIRRLREKSKKCIVGDIK